MQAGLRYVHWSPADATPAQGVAVASGTTGGVVEGSVRRFLPALPKSFYRHPAGGRRAHGCGPLSAAPTARPFRSWAAGCWARKALAVPPRRAAEQPVCPGYQRTTVASAQAKPGCKTPCKRVRGNAGVGDARKLSTFDARKVSRCVTWKSSTDTLSFRGAGAHRCVAWAGSQRPFR